MEFCRDKIIEEETNEAPNNKGLEFFNAKQAHKTMIEQSGLSRGVISLHEGGLELYTESDSTYLSEELSRLQEIAPNAFRSVALAIGNGGLHKIPEEDIDQIHSGNDWVTAMAAVAIRHYCIPKVTVGQIASSEDFRQLMGRLQTASALGEQALTIAHVSGDNPIENIVNTTSARHKVALMPFWKP